MKFAFKSIVAAAAFVAAGAASASSLTLTSGSSVTDQGWTVSNLTGSGTLSFSSTLIGALNAGGVQVSQVSPAVVTTTTTTPTSSKYKTVSAAAPVTSLTGTFDGSTVAVTQVGTAGGALQTAVDDGFTTTGGTLSITNLTVDLTAKRVYATLIGANGVGTVNNLYLWDIATITGATSFAAVEGNIVDQHPERPEDQRQRLQPVLAGAGPDRCRQQRPVHRDRFRLHQLVDHCDRCQGSDSRRSRTLDLRPDGSGSGCRWPGGPSSRQVTM